MKSFFAFLPLAAVLAGCSTRGQGDAAGAGSNIQLRARLLSPVDIQVTWKDKARDAHHIVEWGTEPEGNYTIVAFMKPAVNSFVHPDVVPDTTCYYRVRPYFGPVSNPVEITTGKVAPGQPVEAEDDTWADPKITAAGSAPVKKSIRDTATSGEAAPTDLKAKLIHPTGVQLTWVDHANDEEGYLLEMKTEAMVEFQVCALVGPDVTSYGYAVLPPETRATFRVRAFYLGTPSNLAHQKTGLRPANREAVQGTMLDVQ